MVGGHIAAAQGLEEKLLSLSILLYTQIVSYYHASSIFFSLSAGFSSLDRSVALHLLMLL